MRDRHEIDPLNPLPEISAALDTLRQFREMQAADPAKALLEMQAADPAKALREIQAADPAKALREMTAALDPLKEFREMTGRLTRSAILDWTREVASAVSEPSDEILADFEATLNDGSPVEAEPVSQWLTQLPPLALAQRRLFLLALAGLWVLTDVLDPFAGVSQPAHLDKVLAALLAIATFLNELIGESSPSDQWVGRSSCRRLGQAVHAEPGIPSL
ncbi:MAG: hypothetical protein ACLP4R_10965 [Solirubrobacteraceae bacterium]